MIKAAGAVLLIAELFMLPANMVLAKEASNVVPPKMLLVLQCGSDWCLSGEDVRRVFEGAEFRSLLGEQYEFAVYDNMDFPTPEVKEANKRLDASIVPSKRFPAITCLTGKPHRFLGQLENIPFDISAKTLAAQITSVARMKEVVLECFANAKKSTEAKTQAELYGKAFELLTAQAGEFNEKSMREGALAWKDEWKALTALDKDDRFGWRFRFEKGVGVELVQKATSFRTDSNLDGGRKFIEALRRIPSEHFTLELKQAVDMAEYALYRKESTRSESNKALLRRIMSLGCDTIWGQCAHGYLMLSGESLKPRTPYRAPVRPRIETGTTNSAAFPLSNSERIVVEISPTGKLSEKQKLEIVRYAVLRRIGKDGWEKLSVRPGAEAFINAFFSDREWLEDFIWSGKCDDYVKALLALEAIVYQDNGRWVKLKASTGRRFATALALSHFDKDEVWLADMVDAYRSTALSKRLHRLALEQEVWKWRVALAHTMPCSTPHGIEKYQQQYLQSIPQQQRFLDSFVNLPLAQYANTCWIVPYRSFNCFGENVQGKFYYESWLEANVSTIREITPRIGGVCGELSKLGSGCGNAHGLPSAPVGQPRHCALTRRLPVGAWEINYSVTRGTGFFSILPFKDTESYTYCQAHEGTFEGSREDRLTADRYLELAAFAESKKLPIATIESYYAAACKAWPNHYISWRSRSDWIVSARRPLEEHRLFVNECVRVLKGWRKPLWDILSPYFKRVAEERGLVALADELVAMMPLFKQGDEALREEGFFDRALSVWTRPLKKDIPQMERVAIAALKTQLETSDYFSQAILWGVGVFEKDEALLARYVKLIENILGNEGAGKNLKADFGKLVLSASKSGNLAVFRQAIELQKLFSKTRVGPRAYPKEDFGGRLVSADGMLQTSSTSVWDHPGCYGFALDESAFLDNAFHTRKERSPWGMVVLPGECIVRGVLVVNKTPGKVYRSRQAPIEVQLSEDGKEWMSVFTDKEVRDEYRIDLTGQKVKGRFVRVRRTPGAKDEVFHLNKILVYGDRLY